MREIFGKRLRMARTMAGLSQRSLGVKIGLDTLRGSLYLHRYEKGDRAPTFQKIGDLAQALNVPASYLFSEDDISSEIILLLGRMTANQREMLLKDLKEKIEMGV